MALPKTALGAYLIGVGFVLLVASFLPLPDRATLLLGIFGQVIPIIGISYMQKDAKRFGGDHVKRVNIALAVGFIALIAARFLLRGIVKRHTISPDVFDGLPMLALIDVFVASLAVFALWTLASSIERKVLFGGLGAVAVSSGITASVPALANGGTDIGTITLVALGLLVVGYVILAAAAGLFGKRFAAADEPIVVPSVA